jgi:hypothetical protein
MLFRTKHKSNFQIVVPATTTRFLQNKQTKNESSKIKPHGQYFRTQREITGGEGRNDNVGVDRHAPTSLKSRTTLYDEMREGESARATKRNEIVRVYNID